MAKSESRKERTIIDPEERDQLAIEVARFKTQPLSVAGPGVSTILDLAAGDSRTCFKTCVLIYMLALPGRECQQTNSAELCADEPELPAGCR